MQKTKQQSAIAIFVNSIAIAAAAALLAPAAFAGESSKGAEPAARIEGKHIDVCALPDGRLRILDKRGGNVFEQLVPSNKILSVSQSGQTIEICMDAGGFRAVASVKICSDSAFELAISADSKTKMEKPLAFPPAWKMEKSDTGIYPLGTGYAFPVDMPKIPVSAKTACCGGANWSMALSAVKRGDSVLVSAAATPCDALVVNEYKEGLMHTAFEWISQKGQFEYDRKMRFFVGDGLVDAMGQYRKWREENGFVKTLKQKAETSPRVNLLRGAANVWLWDDNATNRLYARPENPNAPKRDPRKIADEMVALGMRRVLWNNFEGETLQDCLYLQKLGFLVGKYDIYRDVLPKTLVDKVIEFRVKRSVNTKYWPDIVRIGKHGDMALAWQVHGKDAKMYYQHSVCEICAFELTKINVPKDLKNVPYDARLIDVQAQSNPVECYSPKHPATRTESFKNIALQQKFLGGLGLVRGVECGQEYFVAEYEYAEGLLSPYPFRIPDAGRRMTDRLKRSELNPEMESFMLNPKYRIPLWELAYHDCAVNYWYWGVSSCICPEIMHKFDAFDALYGYPPIYSLDVSGWNLLKEKIAESYKRVSPIAELVGFEKMTNFEYLTDDKLVQKTTFSNGASVVANFGESDYALPGGKTVRPWSFALVFDR